MATLENVQPLTEVSSTQKDALGMIVRDGRGVTSRRFVYCQLRGSTNAVKGDAVVVPSMTEATSKSLYEVTTESAQRDQGRNAMGVWVGSTATSGWFGWVLNRGPLGKVSGSKYPDTIYAVATTTIAATDGLKVSGAATKIKIMSANTAGTSNAVIMGHAWSTDVSGKLTRGYIRVPVLDLTD